MNSPLGIPHLEFPHLVPHLEFPHLVPHLDSPFGLSSCVPQLGSHFWFPNLVIQSGSETRQLVSPTWFLTWVPELGYVYVLGMVCGLALCVVVH